MKAKIEQLRQLRTPLTKAESDWLKSKNYISGTNTVICLNASTQDRQIAEGISEKIGDIKLINLREI